MPDTTITFEHWVMNPPTYLTEDEALERGAKVVRGMYPDPKTDHSLLGSVLALLMWHWAETKSDAVFKARFYDWRKEQTDE